MRYLLVGNYGVSNAGDEVLREYFLERFPEVQWRVLSANPQAGELPRLPAGMRSLLSLRWLRTVRALRSADGVVFGGGSLFTDAESLHACCIWGIHAVVTRARRKPYFLAFQGIGPFRTRLGEWWARWVLAHATFVSVRDSLSAARVEAWGSTCSERAPHPFSKKGAGRVELWKKNTEVIQSFDPSILLMEEPQAQERTKNLLIFVPRFSTLRLEPVLSESERSEDESKGSVQAPPSYKGILAALKRWSRERGPVRVLSLQPAHEAERELCHSLAKQLGCAVHAVPSLRAMTPLLEGALCVLTERYHGAVAALACGVPFLALRRVQEDKLDALAEFCGCPCVTREEFSEDLLWSLPSIAKRAALGAKRAEAMRLARAGEEALRKALRSVV